MEPLVIIPARGGSKGVPKKNIKLLGNKPLIQYTIEAALEVFEKSQICVSTDDMDIIQLAESLGIEVPFVRPSELAADHSSTQDVLLHALNFYTEKKQKTFEQIVLLQPTSPFRTGKQIKEALDLFDETCEMVVSVKETKANPYYILREETSEGWLEPSKKGHFIRRQDAPKVWELNGAIYIIDVKTLYEKPIAQLTKVRKYEMDEISSHDIDSIFDWQMAECMQINKL